MIYTSGIISDIEKEETLEELQDNKLAIVCEKLELQKGESLLDIGCGWGTLARFASVNFETPGHVSMTVANHIEWCHVTTSWYSLDLVTTFRKGKGC